MTVVKITIDKKGVSVDKDPVPVPRSGKPERITWKIGTPGWKFTRDGIVIHWNFNQFTARGSDNGQEFHWTTRNRNKRRYEYTINVTNGKTKATRDPGIKNGGK